ITGQVIIGFTPNAINNADDPNVIFTSGSRTVNFTIPVGSTQAQYSPANLMLQAGTVAGTIMLASTFQVGATNVTPTPPPTHQIVVNQFPPTLLDNVQVVRTASGFEIEVSGYSTTRDLQQATFRFTAPANRSLQTSELTVNLASVSTTWYQSPSSVAV